jgi:ATP phosphoribosyltransferase
MADGSNLRLRSQRGIDMTRGLLSEYSKDSASTARLTATVSSLQDPKWLAVRSMVLSADVNQMTDELFALGAKRIFVTSNHACSL